MNQFKSLRNSIKSKSAFKKNFLMVLMTDNYDYCNYDNDNSEKGSFNHDIIDSQQRRSGEFIGLAVIFAAFF